MANWKKKEAGFVVVRPSEDSTFFVLEKFHNSAEREKVEEKYSFFDPTPFYEYHVGEFISDGDIEAAMDAYRLNSITEIKEVLEPQPLTYPEFYEYRYAVVSWNVPYGSEEWSEPCTEEEAYAVEIPDGVCQRIQYRIGGGRWQEKEERYNIKDWRRIFCEGK